MAYKISLCTKSHPSSHTVYARLASHYTGPSSLKQRKKLCLNWCGFNNRGPTGLPSKLWHSARNHQVSHCSQSHARRNSDQGPHFMGHDIQHWALEQNIDWRFHVPYKPTGMGLIKNKWPVKNPFTYIVSGWFFKVWTKTLLEAVQILNESPTNTHGIIPWEWLARPEK